MVDLLDIFLTPYQRTARRIGELQDAVARERRARRAAEHGQDEQIARLASENDRLRLWVAALTEILLAKGVLSDQELREAVACLQPPPPPAGEESPFAGLGS
jgi:hypothetical protein